MAAKEVRFSAEAREKMLLGSLLAKLSARRAKMQTTGSLTHPG